MKFENQICPVCDKVFTENDEIVVCPECGTPHHRDCYFSLGSCKNEPLHKSGFSYKPIEVTKETIDVLIGDEVKNTSEEKKEFNELVNVEFNDENAEKNENIQEAIKDLFNSINGKTADQVLIDNIPSSYFEAAIGKNQNYYLPRFFIIEGTQKKMLLNVCAFLFPMAWAFYRKMYKLSLLVFALYIALTAIVAYPIYTNDSISEAIKICVEEDPECFNDLSLYMMGENVTLTKNQTDLMNIINETTPSTIVVYGTLFASMAMKITIGLNATKLYKRKLKNNILKAQKLNLDDSSLKKLLTSKYGVAPMVLAYIIGFFEYTLFRYF